MKTTNDYRGYVFSIEYMPDDMTYIVDYPDIPEIITSGSTLDEAFHNACEALDLHLESLEELGYPMPKQTQRITIVSA
ncbi:MAG: type II toxin-antitoxin system HicB family antitoxin [Calditrichaeota bacterium]|nr:type II toxin-antitoxin system HicB family antitoxin [Calditrichota bacterium]